MPVSFKSNRQRGTQQRRGRTSPGQWTDVMNDMSGVDRAVKRVMDALDALDAAMELRVEDDRKRGGHSEQVHAFNIDRARLASELDGAQARSRELETTNREAARRIDEAMSAIRAVIAANQN
jgi:hypothetical protein